MDPPSGHCRCLPPWASGVARRLIRTARGRARATSYKHVVQSYSSGRSVKTPTFAFPALQPVGAQKAQDFESNAKHGSHMLRSSSEAARSVRTHSRWYQPSGSFCRESLADDPDGCRKVAGDWRGVRRIMRSSAGTGGSEGTRSLCDRVEVICDPQLFAALDRGRAADGRR